MSELLAPGDAVTVVGRVTTLFAHGRPSRTVPPGTSGTVERVAERGALVRLVVSDASDGRTDVVVCHHSQLRRS